MGRSEAGLTAACTVIQDLISCMMAVKWWLVTCLVAAMVLVTSATPDSPAESREAGEYLASDSQEVGNIRQQREANKGKAKRKANKGKAKRKANKGKANRKAKKGKAKKRTPSKREANKRKSSTRKARKRTPNKRKAKKRTPNKRKVKNRKAKNRKAKNRKAKNRKANKGKANKGKASQRKNIKKGIKQKQTATVNLTCLRDAVTFTKFPKDNVVNFMRRNTRLTAQNALTNKKAQKKGEYKEPAARLIQAGGGDKTNLSCSGSTTSVGAKRIKAVADVLD